MSERSTFQKILVGANGTPKSARHLGIDVRTEIVEGDPEKEIEEKAESDSANLIVVGHRDIAQVRHWLEGSTSEALVLSSRVSVLVVRDDQP